MRNILNVYFNIFARVALYYEKHDFIKDPSRFSAYLGFSSIQLVNIFTITILLHSNIGKYPYYALASSPLVINYFLIYRKHRRETIVSNFKNLSITIRERYSRITLLYIIISWLPLLVIWLHAIYIVFLKSR